MIDENPTSEQIIERDKENLTQTINDVFSSSNSRYGQFMPQEYVTIFINELSQNYNVEIHKKDKK